MVAEATTWDAAAELIRGYVIDSWTDDSEPSALVDALTRDADTDREKLRALHSFVSTEIRYVGIETAVNGIVPRDTGMTLSRRFGDCKDKTALFLHMAALAGIDAHAVLVSSHRV